MRRTTIILGLVFLWAAAAATPAAARSMVIESFDVEIEVKPDASLLVTETIRPRFIGAWNGMYRTIPVEYRTTRGFNYSLLLDVLGVTDERGNPLRREVRRERHYKKIKIWVPQAQDVTRTVVLRYRVQNGLKFFEDHDELYWNVTGDEWDFPIERATASIFLPSGANGVRATAFTGAYGSREKNADVAIERNEIHMQMRRPLGFREGLTAVIGWDKGLVREPGLLLHSIFFLRSNWPLSIPVLVFAVMFSLWRTRGRDPRRRPITVRYEPPEGLSPAEVGTVIDNSPDMRDITASLVDLAIRGYLRIEEKQQEEGLFSLWSGNRYVFHRLKPAEEWKDLKPHERELLGGVFTSGIRQEVDLSELENEFYKFLSDIRDDLFNQLSERGYYTSRPDRVRQLYLGAAVVMVLLSVVGAGLGSSILGIAWLTCLVAGLASAAIVAGFGWFMPARTFSGARVFEEVRGFEEFLSRVETDSFKRVPRTPETFEKYLPFAMALGVERKWARAFDDIYRQPPNWYQGTNFQSFRCGSFVNDLGRMSTRAASVLTSAPRSVGGSGFSSGGGSSGGGGFSGGGFGGGGGGGF